MMLLFAVAVCFCTLFDVSSAHCPKKLGVTGEYFFGKCHYFVDRRVKWKNAQSTCVNADLDQVPILFLLFLDSHK